ncbi:Nif3-like dinuclear metal center hexameric protein [Crassaminicella profunda]|uniref:Nif3-like dinuclear metal center hexameric protein n=1 Tax=Crassaminicella profunda TaxID=1286698 RepID=UPI001CA76945|nr:Nif3-like dinuclear metal center hexameric protein [Crassaminicella profunda]QZY56571.1 Nif3-like dinuclear metal center hexameric protein [Crassaminicella profunda]
MAEKLESVVKLMENIAPSYLAENWDNVGLQIGNAHKDIHRILVALEVTEAIIDEAISKNVDMIVCHHPLIFKPLKKIRIDDPIGNMVYRLIKNDITLFCAHTNLDIAHGGTNDVLAQILNIMDTKPLRVMNQEKYFKLVVYVPRTHVENVRDAICRAGAGHIGNYSHCTFQTEGKGTFKPLEGTNPFIGTKGEIEKVAECRLESIVPKEKLNGVIKKMVEVHPYEEVAYDLFTLKNDIHSYGLGRVGNLIKPIKLSAFCQEIKSKLAMNVIRIIGDTQKSIQRVGLCTGSGAEFIYDAYKLGCDCYITGDVKYHDAQYAASLGIAVIDAGHFETEHLVCRPLFEKLKELIMEKNYHMEVFLASNNMNPFQTI